jgi:hypothetical protein
MKNNPTSPKTIAGVILSAFLFNSCAKGYYVYESVNAINEQERVTAFDFNNIAIPIDIEISPEVYEYFLFLEILIKDIINNPFVAQEFAKDPNKYINKHGFNEINISIDGEMLKFIFALADEQLIESLKNNDFAHFFQLCKEKELFNDVNNIDFSIYRQILEDNGIDLSTFSLVDLEGDELRMSAFLVALAVLVAAGAVVLVWGVVVSHVAAGTFTVAAAAVAWSVGVGPTKPQTPKSPTIDPHLFRLWQLQTQDLQSFYLFQLEYEEQLIHNCIEAAQNQYPEEMQNIDINALKNVIAINISKNKLQHQRYDNE